MECYIGAADTKKTRDVGKVCFLNVGWCMPGAASRENLSEGDPHKIAVGGIDELYIGRVTDAAAAISMPSEWVPQDLVKNKQPEGNATSVAKLPAAFHHILGDMRAAGLDDFRLEDL